MILPRPKPTQRCAFQSCRCWVDDLARQSQEARHFILRDFEFGAGAGLVSVQPCPSDSKRLARRAGTDSNADSSANPLTQRSRAHSSLSR